MDFAEIFKQNANNFYQSLKDDTNGRYLSWEHCYSAFYKARNRHQSELDIDYLALHLSFYLASWGMYRGSSFLLWKDYKVHIPVVTELLSKKYDSLLGIKCCDFQNRSNQIALTELNTYLGNYYNSIRLSVVDNAPKNKLSDTLITKILMGTLGCVPAYDRYFNYGIKKHKISTANYNIKSILMLCKFYQDNLSEFEPICQNMMIGDIPYPQMKFLDMGFWEIGYRDDMSNQGKTPH